MGKGGDSTDDAGTTPAPQSTVLEDPRFQPFQSDNFNVAEFTSRVLAGSHTTASAQSDQLRDGVRLLEAELSGEVVQHSRELLHHVRRMLDAETSVRDVVLSVESLQSAVRRIRAEVAGPYEQIKYKTQQLRSIHGTVDLLRHVIHRLKLAQKLRAQMDAPPAQQDLAKAAKLITDIRAVDAEVDLSRVEAVAADAGFLETAYKAVQEQAMAALLEGVESLSQAKVGSALQVLFNLDELKQAVNSLLARHLADLDKAVKAALDSRQLAASVGQGGQGAAAAASAAAARGQAAPGAQDKMWQALRDVLEQLSSSTVAVWHLQRVVAKKRDPLTHVCFLDLLVGPGEQLLSERFWVDVVKHLGDAFASVSRPGKGGWVRDALSAQYPRLAHQVEAMFERLAAETSIKGVLPAVTPEHLSQLLAATGPFQSAYLAGCLSRMTEAVVAAFPSSSRQLPAPTDVQKCIGLLHEELKVGSNSPQLAALIASTAAKALALLAERAEYAAAGAQELRALPGLGPGGVGIAVGGGASAAQLRNIALCSQLQEIHRSLCTLLTRLPPTVGPAIGPSLDALQSTALDIVSPLFRALMEAVEERLLRMHSWEGYGGDGGSDDFVSTTPHVAEVVTLLTDFRSEYLAKFVPPPSPNTVSCVGALVERMACRTLVFFVRHAALLRPLTQAGKLQVAKDLAELQAAVGQQLYPLEQLGAPYRAVKAFRALLFTEARAVPSSPLLAELPHVITLQHLFSRLPASVQAPHERSGLSALQYSLWLDSHSHDEALRSIRGALQAVPTSAVAALEGEAADALRVMNAMASQQQG